MATALNLPRAQLRLGLALAATLALLLTLAMAAAIATAMLLPREWHALGTVRELRGVPQLRFVAGKEIYLVWDGDTPLTLSTRDPHSGVCQIRWWTDWGLFADPCGGSAYQPNGDYWRGPSPRSMDRFGVRVVDGVVEVNVDQFAPGASHP